MQRVCPLSPYNHSHFGCVLKFGDTSKLTRRDVTWIRFWVNQIRRKNRVVWQILIELSSRTLAPIENQFTFNVGIFMRTFYFDCAICMQRTMCIIHLCVCVCVWFRSFDHIRTREKTNKFKSSKLIPIEHVTNQLHQQADIVGIRSALYLCQYQPPICGRSIIKCARWLMMGLGAAHMCVTHYIIEVYMYIQLHIIYEYPNVAKSSESAFAQRPEHITLIRHMYIFVLWM